jgi:tripartite-type tricarboxylate transporter receptor subunit TctC
MKAMRDCLGFLLLAAIGFAVHAQPYPNKPIRVVVPFPAGGPSDVGMRLIAQKMTESMGQQVLVDNRPGANTIIGAEAVAKAAPDGYTLLCAIDSTLTMNQFLFRKLPYDPIKDFAPISLILWSPVILVTDAATGPKSVKELIQEAKANPGKVNFGAGTVATQLIGEQIKSRAGIDMVHVPYKGSPETVKGLLSNDVRFILDGVTSSVPHIRSGKFRALANLGVRPISALPGLPVFATEADMPGFEVGVWLGVVATAGTPAAIVDRLNQEIGRALAMPDVREKLASSGLEPFPGTPAEFAAFIKKEAERTEPMIRKAGIRLD